MEDRRQEHPHTHQFLPRSSGPLPPLTCLPPCPIYPLPFSMTAEGNNCVRPGLQHLAPTRASANCQRNERARAFLLWKISRPQKNPPFNNVYLHHSESLTWLPQGPWHDLATSLIPTTHLHSLASGHSGLLTEPQHAGPTPALTHAHASTSACHCVLGPSQGWFHPARWSPPHC